MTSVVSQVGRRALIQVQIPLLTACQGSEGGESSPVDPVLPELLRGVRCPADWGPHSSPGTFSSSLRGQGVELCPQWSAFSASVHIAAWIDSVSLPISFSLFPSLSLSLSLFLNGQVPRFRRGVGMGKKKGGYLSLSLSLGSGCYH